MNNLKDYYERSGDTQLGLGWMEENEHGFCVWRGDPDGTLILVNVYGDGRYWNEWADKKAEEIEATNILFATRRNPAGFVRKFGYEVTGYILERTAKWAA